MPKFAARWRPLRPRGRLGAAAAARARALATVLHEYFADAGDGDACGSVRLLLSELAAALRAGPERQGQPGAAAGQGQRSRARRRREQRTRATRARFGVGGGVDANVGGAGGEQNNQKDISLVKKKPPAQELAACERLVAGGAITVEKDYGAICDAGGREAVAQDKAESAGGPRRKRQLMQQQQPAAPAAARTAGPAPAEMAQMAAKANDEPLACAEPRVAAAAEPHKRRAVAAGTAVGPAVGVGGNGEEGTWTTVLSRRARRQERARLVGTACAAAHKAAAARTAAARRTAAAMIEHLGME